MRKLILMLSSAAFAGGALAVNPIITHKYSADPNAFVWNDRLYVMCSHDTTGQDGFEMHDYILLSTDDLVNWTDHGDVFRGGKDVKWCWNLYAPGVAVKNGKVYLYYPNSGGPIGVAVADRPEGPYTDPLGKPLISYEMPGCDSAWVFDPAAFVDDDGQGYLYFGGNGGTMARVIRLNGDMTSAQFPAKTLTAAKDGKDSEMPAFFEASFLHKHNGKYYFSYSANFPDRGASIDYAMGDSPLGPFEWKGAMLPNFPDNDWNNNHQSVVEFRGKSYIFYHSRLLTNRQGHGNVFERSVGLDELTYNADGTIVPVVPTHEGPKQLKPLNPYAQNRAVTICQDENVTVTMAGTQSVVTALGDGAWLRYAGFKFVSAPGSVTVRCRAHDTAALEIRKGAKDGPVVAKLALGDTKGRFARVSAPVTGLGKDEVCDLWFVFTGKARGVEFADYQFAKPGAKAPLALVKKGAKPDAIDAAPVRRGLDAYRKGFGLVAALAAGKDASADVPPFRFAEPFVTANGGETSVNEGRPSRRDYNLEAWASDKLYMRERWSQGPMSVTIGNLTPGEEYLVEWHCCEQFFGNGWKGNWEPPRRRFKVFVGAESQEDLYEKAVRAGVEFSDDGKMLTLRPYSFRGKAKADAKGQIVVRAEPVEGGDNPVFAGIAVWGHKAPAKPAKPSVTREGDTFAFSWKGGPDTLRTYLQASDAEQKKWTDVASVEAGVETLKVPAASAGETCYRLCASNGVGLATSPVVKAR